MVLAVHVVAIVVLARANPSLVDAIGPPPLHVMLLSTAVAAVEPPPPPEVKLELPQVEIEPPVLPVMEWPEQPAVNTAITLIESQAPPSAVRPRGIPQLVSEVEYVVAPRPGYPTRSRRLREQGLVVLRVLVDEYGHAQQLSVHESSGHERLDRAALDAVARAEFKPYVSNGLARRVYVLIPIEFALSRSSNPNG